LYNHLGYIVGIGKAGNPGVMQDVTDGMIIGVTTEVLAGYYHANLSLYL
jgi:urease alpha subunit